MNQYSEKLKMLAEGNYDGLLHQQNALLNRDGQPSQDKFAGYQGLDPMTKPEVLKMYSPKAKSVLANFSLRNITDCFVIYDNLNHINQLAIDITHETRVLSILFYDQNQVTTLEISLYNKQKNQRVIKTINYPDVTPVELISDDVKVLTTQVVNEAKAN